MGLFSRKPSVASSPAPAQKMMTVATRSYLFDSPEKATQFMASAQTSQSHHRNDLISFLQLNHLAGQYGGELVRSSTGRESLVYGYLPLLADADRDYLVGRDPTAMMFASTPWDDIWGGFPTTYIDTIDAYFSEQLALGLLFALQAAYQEFYLHGGALVYLETTGPSESKLARGDRPLRWCFVPASLVVDQDAGPSGYILTDPSEKSPLLDHGIEYISIYPTQADKIRGTPIRVHGSKIIPINLDPKHQKWWRCPPSKIPFNAIHDTLWELRDLIFSRVRAHFQASPIIVDVDLSEEAQRIVAWENMSEDKRKEIASQMEAEIANYNSGAKTTFAPVMGLKMRRLEAADLPDPREDIMLLSSRLSHGSPFPVKMVLASTKGASDTEDQDILTYASRLQRYRNTWGHKHLSKSLLMGQIMGASGLRLQEPFFLPPPSQIEKDWPLIRVLSPRDSAFVEKTDTAIYRESQEMSLLPPTRIQRKFAKDPRYQIPLWLASKGRKTDGTSADPVPISPAGGQGSEAHTRSIVQEEIEEHETEAERRATQESKQEAPHA